MRNPLQRKTHSPVSLVKDLVALYEMSFFDIDIEAPSSDKTNLFVNVSTQLRLLSLHDEATRQKVMAVLKTEIAQCSKLLILFLVILNQFSRQELHDHTAIFFDSLMYINSSSTAMEKAICQALTLQFKNRATSLHLFKSACLTTDA